MTVDTIVPLASSFNLCTVIANVSFSSNSLSRNAFLSMACYGETTLYIKSDKVH